MTVEELFHSLSGLEYLNENIKARLNVLLVDEIINENDLSNMTQTINNIIVSKDIDGALKSFNNLDTHIREQTFAVLMDVYKK